MKNQLTKGYLVVVIAVSFLLSPLGAAAVGVTWDYSSSVLKPLAAVIGSRTSIGTTTATTNATLTVSATSTDTTTVLSLLKSTGVSVLSALAGGNIGIGTTSPFAKLSVHANDGDTNATVFAIASSTASATTTLFSVSNAGVVSINGNTLTVSGNTTLNDWFNQSVKTTASPSFAGLTVNSFALTVSGAATLNDWFDQSVKQAASPTFNALTLTTDLSVANGGTGASTLTGLLQGNGTSAITGVTGTTGQFPYYSGSSALTATSSILVDTNQRVGISSTTPQRTLSVGGSIAAQECALTDGATVTFDLSTCNQGKVVLGGNRALDFTNETQALGQTIRAVICQDGTGSRTLTWDSAIRWAGGTAPTLTTTANRCDVLAGFTTVATGTPVILLDKVLNF